MVFGMKLIGDTGLLEMTSHTKCPNCGNDLGYYGDIVSSGGFECDACGIKCDLIEQWTYWYKVIE